eukprot:3209882-Pyramimonas_sp.AAC.1
MRAPSYRDTRASQVLEDKRVARSRGESVRREYVGRGLQYRRDVSLAKLRPRRQICGARRRGGRRGSQARARRLAALKRCAQSRRGR